MSNYITKTQSIKASNQVELKVFSHEVEDDETRDTFSVITSFFRSAALLPKGEFLGWQLTVDYENNAFTFAFSSNRAKVTAKDFNWIFEDYAINIGGDDAVKTSNPPDWFGRKDRKIYTLAFRETDGAEQDYDFWPDHMQCCCKALAKMLAEPGGIIRVLAESDGEGMALGDILFSLPGEMTLRMRSVLSAVFPGTIVEELDRGADLQDRERRLSTAYIEKSMAGVMRAIRPEVEDIGYEPFETCGPDGPVNLEELDDEDWVDFFDVPEMGNEGFTPIDDMEFSVRTYNCLKRAGVDSMEELQKLSDDELQQVRNLGRKGYEEIKQKLVAFGGQEVPVLPKSEKSAQDSSAMLEELIGLKDVKEQIRKIKALAKMKCDMAKRGKKSVPIALNMEFVGNPGTAKTTVARIVAGIFHEIGLLSGKEVVEVGRADLVAKYVGQTADKVKSAFRKAKGSILFIDEAYSLVDSQENSFGDEAIHTIVQEMENNREDTVVIFAGYPDKMEKFFLRNPGLRSRVAFKISFPDYSIDEMVQIAEMESRKRGFAIGEQAKEKVKGICEAAVKHPEAGNGRFCRNLVENAVLAYALRVYGDSSESGGEELVLAAEDFEIPEMLKEKRKTTSIGFRA